MVVEKILGGVQGNVKDLMEDVALEMMNYFY